MVGEMETKEKPKPSPDYLMQLMNDKKLMSSLPNFCGIFNHLERLLDEEISRVRKDMYNDTLNGSTEKRSSELPDAVGPIVQLQEKLYVPVKEYPDSTEHYPYNKDSPQRRKAFFTQGEVYRFNFVGRILGPRGLTAKQLEAETGCKIMVRGKGSMRDKKKEEQNRGKPNWEHLNEDLHVLITVEDAQNRAEIKLKRAVEEVNKLLVPASMSLDPDARTLGTRLKNSMWLQCQSLGAYMNRKALGNFVTEKVSEGERRRQDVDGAVKKQREKRAIGWVGMQACVYVYVSLSLSRWFTAFSLERTNKAHITKLAVITQAEGEDSLKKMQLMELAILNGTYRDANIKSPALAFSLAASAQAPRIISGPAPVLPPAALRTPAPAGPTIMPLIRQIQTVVPNGSAHAHAAATLVPPGPESAGLIYAAPYEYPYTLAPATSILEYPIDSSGVLGKHS
ncbi:hypothetical protein QTP86_032095 [Hemibagrus guttatus]|nr:hypothetical protein QTP86_032095 [Hemibagrus guttatus]